MPRTRDTSVRVPPRGLPIHHGLDQATLAAQIYARVRHEILNGELQPGQPMSRRRIATELQTSPLPVASAFQRLEIEGLLESRPRAGTRVRALSLDQIRGHFVVREALETQAAMRVALLATPHELTHLDTLARELDALSAQDDARQYSTLHRGFHRQIAAYSRCDALSDAVDQCHGFSMLWLSRVSHPYQPNTYHQDLVAAISSRDPLKATEVATEHVALGLARAIDTLSSDAEHGPSTLFRRRPRQPPSGQAERHTR